MTASPDLSATDLRPRVADRLWHASAAVLVLMPLGMAVAHRSSPLFLGLSAAFALAALGVEGRFETFRRDAQAALASPLGLMVLAFLGWSVISLAWSAARPTAVRALGEFWLPVAAAFVLALTLPGRMSRTSLWLLAGSIAIACGVIMIELETGLAWRRSIGMRSDRFIFNRPALTVLVLSVPLLFWMHRSKATEWRWTIQAGIGAMVITTIALSESGAAQLGLAVVALAFGLARLLPRSTLNLAGVAAISAIGLAPVTGDIGDRLIPPSVHARLAESHSRERIDLWLSFGAAIREQPLLGIGFGMSPLMGELPVAARVPPERRTLLAIGHPHNAAMQVWAELGLVGAAIGLAILLLLLRSHRGMPTRKLAPRLSLFAAVAAVSLIGHGAWQGWWVAAIGAAIVLFRFTDRVSEETI